MQIATVDVLQEWIWRQWIWGAFHPDSATAPSLPPAPNASRPGARLNEK